MADLKRCPSCMRWLPRDQFHRSGWCRQCRNDRARELEHGAQPVKPWTFERARLGERWTSS